MNGIGEKITKTFIDIYWILKKTVIDSSYYIFPSTKILLYHRIASLKNDPDKLAVSPKNFEAQIKYLRLRYSVISLKDLVDDVKQRKIRKRSLVITFDDGYLDNFTYAKKILEKFDIPATFFVTTDVNKFQKNNSIMSSSQLNKLSKSKLFSIGAHTMSHVRLSEISQKRQKEEIGTSKSKLEEIIGKKIDYFAYPFGQKEDFGIIAIDLVKKAGYKAACTAILGNVTNYSDIYKLSRYTIKNWELPEFNKRVGL